MKLPVLVPLDVKDSVMRVLIGCVFDESMQMLKTEIITTFMDNSHQA